MGGGVERSAGRGNCGLNVFYEKKIKKKKKTPVSPNYHVTNSSPEASL